MLVSLPPRFKMYSKEAGKMQFPEVRNAHIFIRTFGYFDVFVDGVPILFRSEKAKELLALFGRSKRWIRKLVRGDIYSLGKRTSF